MHSPRAILALDATTALCSVAWTDGVCWVERVEDAGQRHSEMILTMIDAVLGDARCPVRELSEIAFGAGPGSFTGLRIACGVAQGLALGGDVPVRAVSSLMALAQATGEPAVLVAIDARMHEVYWAAYRREQGDVTWTTVIPPAVSAPSAVVPPAAGQWIAAGDGFSAYPEFGARIGAALRIDAGARVTAKHIAALALAGEGAASDAAVAIPYYVRDKVALTSAERAGAQR